MRRILKHLRVRNARRHVTHVCSATVRPRRLSRERLTRDPDDVTPGRGGELCTGVSGGHARRAGEYCARTAADVTPDVPVRKKKGVGDTDTDCTRETATHTTSLNHSQSGPPRTERNTERLVCSESHWPTVVRRRFSNAVA